MNRKPTGDEPSALGEKVSKNPIEQNTHLSGAVQVFVTQMQNLNAGWRVGLAEMQKRDTEFALRLARSPTPSDAMQVCTEWMSSRVGSVFEMQQQFFDLWTRYVGSRLSVKVMDAKHIQGEAQDRETVPTSGTTHP